MNGFVLIAHKPSRYFVKICYVRLSLKARQFQYSAILTNNKTQFTYGYKDRQIVSKLNNCKEHC